MKLLAASSFFMDKIQSANQLHLFLGGVVKNAGFKLKYRISVDPPMADDRDWERPEILVEFAGPDSTLLLARGAELLRSLELLAMEMLHLPGNEHEKISFDCMGHRKARLEELRMSARVAAEKVRQTGSPYQFAPMSSRERRMLHLALRDEQDLRTESDGEGLRRSVVLYPKDYTAPASRFRR
jgi:spoIIIJ-associated protein